jgi:hypothetical protein
VRSPSLVAAAGLKRTHDHSLARRITAGGLPGLLRCGGRAGTADRQGCPRRNGGLELAHHRDHVLLETLVTVRHLRGRACHHVPLSWPPSLRAAVLWPAQLAWAKLH